MSDLEESGPAMTLQNSPIPNEEADYSFSNIDGMSATETPRWYWEHWLIGATGALACLLGIEGWIRVVG